MKKIQKFLAIGLIGTSLFTLFFFFFFGFLPLLNGSPFDDSQINTKQYEVMNITVIIDFGGVQDNKVVENINLTNYKTTVFDAILNCCNVTYNSYPGGAVYVTGIDGVIMNVDLSNHYWFYDVNNITSPVGASHYNLMNNSLIKWYYQ